MTVKVCRSFVGMVNFLSLFCPELQKLLKPICNLTRRVRKFVWDTLIENAIGKYCVPEYIIMDQDSAFMSSLMNYLF